MELIEVQKNVREISPDGNFHEETMINDIKNIRDSGGASMSELREFLKGLKARNPQEVIGIVSASLLIQSLVTSTLLTVGLMAVLTVGPYLVYGPPQAQTANAKPAKKPDGSASDAKAAVTEAQPAATSDQPAKSTSGTPDAEKAAKVMGLDETKAADPKKNPLDKPDLDKLLDGL